MDYRFKCKMSIKFLEGNTKENFDYLGGIDDVLDKLMNVTEELEELV